MPRNPLADALGLDPDELTDLVAMLKEREETVATAESLTGGLVVAELTRIPGASLAVSGGIVAYDTQLKHSILGVSAELLASEGAVHPEVARQMADGVRRALAIDGRPADVGIATTGVAGPTMQDGRAPGTVYLGIALGEVIESVALELPGDRAGVRAATVLAAVDAVLALLARD